MNKKWNWNQPITWKQSIICTGIGTLISLISWVYLWYGSDIGKKVNVIWCWFKKPKKEE